MLALQGYYDGNAVQVLEKIQAKKNQKLIITVLDEFMDAVPAREQKKTARGSLKKYANPALQELEKEAWEKAVVKRYGNA